MCGQAHSLAAAAASEVAAGGHRVTLVTHKDSNFGDFESTTSWFPAISVIPWVHHGRMHMRMRLWPLPMPLPSSRPNGAHAPWGNLYAI